MSPPPAGCQLPFHTAGAWHAFGHVAFACVAFSEPRPIAGRGAIGIETGTGAGRGTIAGLAGGGAARGTHPHTDMRPVCTVRHCPFHRIGAQTPGHLRPASALFQIGPALRSIAAAGAATAAIRHSVTPENAANTAFERQDIAGYWRLITVNSWSLLGSGVTIGQPA